MQARALSLGEAEVRSGLGEPLDLRIPVTRAPGEYIEPSCFKLLTEGSSAVPRVAAGSVSLERSADATFLRLRTGAPINDASVAVGLVAACRGLPQETRREYVVAVNAKTSTASAPSTTGTTAAAPVPVPEPSSLLPSIATLIARIGDTLQSIARAIFPDNSNARRSYIDALRESNPPLAPLADDAQIPVDTPVALPDLRSISKARHFAVAKSAANEAPPPAEPSATIESPAPKKEAPPAKKAKPRAQPPTPPLPRELPAPRASAEPRASKPAPMPKAKTSGDFVLKLSAPTMDLTASRGVDDRTRAKLRERLMVLDSDDQVSALLALRQNVKELETQVAELRLKVSAMPATFPAPKPPPEPPKVEPPKPEATKAVAPPPPAKVEPAPPKVEPAPAKVEPPKAEPPKAVAAPPKVETPKAEAPKPIAIPASEAQPTEWLDYGLWALAAIFIVIAVVLAMRLRRRSTSEPDDDAGMHDLRATAAAKAAGSAPPPEPEDDQIVVAEELPVDLEVAPDIPPPSAVADAPRREIDADVDLPTHIPTNADDLRRRYIEERFPEIGKGAINLDDADSVVKGARLFYEDGALPRAVELLQYTIERKPAELKSWLALFEIFRLERLPGEFAELAGRFKAVHGQSDYWPKVQYFGREIDPGNELYREAPINNFETIGPAQAKKIAAAANVDPVAENWLGAPMDFENEVLANELRKGLMADAGINEPDLVPNPMPALRNIEMFNVA